MNYKYNKKINLKSTKTLVINLINMYDRFKKRIIYIYIIPNKLIYYNNIFS